MFSTGGNWTSLEEKVVVFPSKRSLSSGSSYFESYLFAEPAFADSKRAGFEHAYLHKPKKESTMHPYIVQ